MKDLVNEIVTATTKLMEHTQLNLTLSNSSAVVVASLVCASDIVIYGIYCWEKLAELKLGINVPQDFDDCKKGV